MPAIGVDVGGVIMDRANDDTDTSFFSANYLRSTAVAGAIEGLGALVRGGFGTNVHIVTKCGPSVEARTRDWLAHHHVFTRTGIPPANVHVTRTREGKAPIAATLGLTHFVDDRVDVLAVMAAVPRRYLFTGGGPPGWTPPAPPEGVTPVATWAELVRLVLTGLKPMPGDGGAART